MTKEEHKAIIRAAKAELRILRAGVSECRRNGIGVGRETLSRVADARCALQSAKEDYKEWKRTRR